MSEKLISILGISAALLTAVLIGAAGSQGGLSFSGVPIFVICGVVAFVVQWLVFIPAYVSQTEHYFDLTGSLTYITLSLLVMVLSGFGDLRTLLIGTLVIIWAARLGSFLFMRIREAGEDRRFRKMKTIFHQFLMTWTLQGLWVFITFAAGLAAMTSARSVPLDVFALTGAALWVTGFTIEVVADRQKSAFRANPDNKNRFIQHGLWAWSRHPNYFGEILLWLGITIIALPVLEGWQYATLISPIFVVLLLTKISGVRMLEARAAKQWGDDPEYQRYKARTSTLVLTPPG